MLSNIRVRPTGTGVRMTAFDYAGFHQSGTRRMTARMIAPDPARGLGQRWSTALDRVATQMLRELGGV